MVLNTSFYGIFCKAAKNIKRGKGVSRLLFWEEQVLLIKTGMEEMNFPKLGGGILFHLIWEGGIVTSIKY